MAGILNISAIMTETVELIQGLQAIEPVDHDHDNCPTGKQIPPANRASGTGNKRRCEHCAALG